MITPRVRRFACAAAVVVAIIGCSGESAVRPPDTLAPAATASAAGNERTLAIELTTPVNGAAGMIFSINGPNILSVAPATGFDLVAAPAESKGRDQIDVLVAGPLQTGVIAWLRVKGGNSGHPYRMTVLQVAAGPNDRFVQRDPAAYTLAVRR